MKPLVKAFKSGGFTFAQERRDGNVAIFTKTRQGRDCYEVIIVQTAKAGEFMGVMLPEREKYPSNESFGSKAWCYSKKEDAVAKYYSLLSKN